MLSGLFGVVAWFCGCFVHCCLVGCCVAWLVVWLVVFFRAAPPFACHFLCRAFLCFALLSPVHVSYYTVCGALLFFLALLPFAVGVLALSGHLSSFPLLPALGVCGFRRLRLSLGLRRLFLSALVCNPRLPRLGRSRTLSLVVFHSSSDLPRCSLLLFSCCVLLRPRPPSPLTLGVSSVSGCPFRVFVSLPRMLCFLRACPLAYLAVPSSLPRRLGAWFGRPPPPPTPRCSACGGPVCPFLPLSPRCSSAVHLFFFFFPVGFFVLLTSAYSFAFQRPTSFFSSSAWDCSSRIAGSF